MTTETSCAHDEGQPTIIDNLIKIRKRYGSELGLGQSFEALIRPWYDKPRIIDQCQELQEREHDRQSPCSSQKLIMTSFVPRRILKKDKQHLF